MSLEDVAELSGHSPITVSRMVADLAAGGIVAVIEYGSRLAVRPPGLRPVLVKNVFFGAVPLSVEPFLARVPNLRDAVETLIGAYDRGAKISSVQLERYIEKTNDIDLWEQYASLGAVEARRVLKIHPNLISEVGWPALHFVPCDAIPMLLNAAMEDRHRRSDSPDRPLGRIKQWIENATPTTPDVIERRRTLAQMIRLWLQSEGDSAIAAIALAYAIIPYFDTHSYGPGSSIQLRVTRGLLNPNQLKEIAIVWQDVLAILKSGMVYDYKPIINAVNDWAYPSRFVKAIEETEAERVACDVAKTMIDGLAFIAANRPGFGQQLLALSDHLRHPTSISVDDDFLVLYPWKDRDDWEATEAQQQAAAQTLANSWHTRPSTEVAYRLSVIEQEAKEAGLSWPRWTSLLCSELSRLCSNPIEWAEAFAFRRMPADTIGAFLKEAEKRNDPALFDVLNRLVDNTIYQRRALEIILIRSDSPADLRQKIQPILGEYADLVTMLCDHKALSSSTMQGFLTHENAVVRSAAAIGLWLSDTRGSIPEEFCIDWRIAFLNIPTNNHWLEHILSGNNTLLSDWLINRSTNNQCKNVSIPDHIIHAIRQLNEREREHLINGPITIERLNHRIVEALVGNSTQVYSTLLRNKNLRPYHCGPLMSYRHGVWEILALIALDAGYSAEDVRPTSFPSTWFGNGTSSDRWQMLMDQITLLQSHYDARIRQVIDLIMPGIIAQHDWHLQDERTRKIHGDL